jgi:hypothetical protein
VFRPGSTDDFPIMIEEQVDRPALLIEEHNISSFVGLAYTLAYSPVTNSGLSYSVASSGAPYRHRNIFGAAIGRSSHALKCFVRSSCLSYERGD